ncbi:MAG: SDR family oxidoreductase [Chloroflexi bacterium]|nr:SDR family oxidoreductase [Chloroflexota bacterium]
MTEQPNNNNLILVTGATGYVGGRLVPLLLQAGYRVRVLARDVQRLTGRDWYDQVEACEGDVLKPDTLDKAMQGVSATYYLIHSMTKSTDFHERDVTAARNFATAAECAGVKQIIYLGGLGNPEADLSVHLRSRQITGETLRESTVPVTEFRAAVIVGSGSMSFEMVRYLTELIPIMVCPQWVFTRTQPIAIRNVLQYLIAALETPASLGEVIEIGGADVLTYGDMMLQYAEVRGLNRNLLPVPVLTPRLSSYWVHWMTPVPASIVRPLIEGLRNEVIVRDDKAEQIFPQIEPMTYRQAVELALVKLDAGEVETTWNDALATSQGDNKPYVLATHDGMLLEKRQIKVNAPPSDVYAVFTGLGGERGWPYNWLWQLRGILDRLIGGVGFRRGRRDPNELRIGDALDFWRVETVDPNHLLRLRAEMLLPGRAWLQFEAVQVEDNLTRLTQTAFFAPKGLLGFAYWYGIYPIHGLIFSGMIRKLAAQAEARAG